jgi:hypothetical protein
VWIGESSSIWYLEPPLDRGQGVDTEATSRMQAPSGTLPFTTGTRSITVPSLRPMLMVDGDGLKSARR